MKKCFAMMLSLSLLLGAFACAAPELNEPGSLPIVTEPITFTCFMPPQDWVDQQGNLSLLKYAEDTNIQLDIINGDLNVMLAAYDLPDIAVQAGLSNQRLMEYGAQGILPALNDYLTYCPYFVSVAQERYPLLLDDLTAPDGNIYGLTTVAGTTKASKRLNAYINIAWLEQLGLDYPRTTEEYADVLRAFQGIGEDIFPLTGHSNYVQYFLLNAFILTDAGNHFLYVEEDGTLAYAPVQDEFREGLRWIAGLYQEGLIDPGCFTQTHAAVSQLNADYDHLRIGSAVAQHMRVVIDGLDRDSYMQYDALEPLTGPEGKAYTPWLDSTRASGAWYIITEACENPAAAVAYFDYWIQPQNFMLNWIGQEGVEWRWAEDGEVNFKGEPAKVRDMRYDGDYVNPYAGQATKANFALYPQMFWEIWNEWHSVDIDNPYSPHWWTYDILLLGSHADRYSAYVGDANPTRSIGGMWLDEENSAQISQTGVILKTFVDESIVAFITGELDVESDWSNYVAQVESYGLDGFLELVNGVYAEQK